MQPARRIIAKGIKLADRLHRHQRAERAGERAEHAGFGAQPTAIDPETHDRLMACVSHLPHVLANLLVAQGILKKLGVKSETAASGVLALEALALKPFDLVLMDIQMPVLDGHQATKKLRQTKYLKPTGIS